MSTPYLSEANELFWALRGGGVNFGVVTRHRAARHPRMTRRRAVLPLEPPKTAPHRPQEVS